MRYPITGTHEMTVINNSTLLLQQDGSKIAKPRNAIATHIYNGNKNVAPIQGNLGGTQDKLNPLQKLYSFIN